MAFYNITFIGKQDPKIKMVDFYKIILYSIPPPSYLLIRFIWLYKILNQKNNVVLLIKNLFF